MDFSQLLSESNNQKIDDYRSPALQYAVSPMLGFSALQNSSFLSPYSSPMPAFGSPSLFDSPALSNSLPLGLEDDFWSQMSLPADLMMPINEGQLEGMLFGGEMDQVPALLDSSPAPSLMTSPQLDFGLVNPAESPLLQSAAGLFVNNDILSQLTQMEQKQPEISFIHTSFNAENPDENPGAESYKCPHPGCTKKFTMVRTLMAHQLVHSTDRKYACQHCGARFRRTPDLNRHMRSMHTVGTKAFLCPHNCGKSFPRTDALKRHLTVKPKSSKFGCAVLQAQLHGKAIN